MHRHRGRTKKGSLHPRMEDSKESKDFWAGAPEGKPLVTQVTGQKGNIANPLRGAAPLLLRRVAQFLCRQFPPGSVYVRTEQRSRAFLTVIGNAPGSKDNVYCQTQRARAKAGGGESVSESECKGQ
ncbi:hypothetical protein NDU88_002745 [Pleurodeles waltl]|uniref:Uncharacterized protein n=1 Tax=Pleurodeles waltl TaxID=8319 RepID=A0AAV7Q7L3_PLEWA|nr:hypothetical protein NDU88_002745 [Pleurodeles waltl]